MVETRRDVTTENHLHLEIQLIINRRLYERNVIDTATYETAKNEILRELQKLNHPKGAD